MVAVHLLWVVLCSSVPWAVGEIVDVNYAVDFLKKYDINNPLRVKTNDILRVVCQANLTADIYRLDSAEEFTKCFIMERKPVARCENTDEPFGINIIESSATLPSLVSYVPGNTYYFTSFYPDVRSAPGNLSGGLCSMNFKFALHVISLTATTTTTTTSSSSPSEKNDPEGLEPSDPKGMVGNTNAIIIGASVAGVVVLTGVIMSCVVGMCYYILTRKKLSLKSDIELSPAKKWDPENGAIKNEVKRGDKGEITKSDWDKENKNIMSSKDRNQPDVNHKVSGYATTSKEKDKATATTCRRGVGTESQSKAKSGTTPSAATSGSSSAEGRTASNKGNKKPLLVPSSAKNKNHVKDTGDHSSGIISNDLPPPATASRPLQHGKRDVGKGTSTVGNANPPVAPKNVQSFSGRKPQPPSNQRPLPSNKVAPNRAPPQRPTGRLSPNAAVISSLRAGQSLKATNVGRDKGLHK